MLLREVYLNGSTTADELFSTLNDSLDRIPMPQVFIDSYNYVTPD